MSNSIASINYSLSISQLTAPQEKATAIPGTKTAPAYLPEDTVQLSAAAKAGSPSS